MTTMTTKSNKLLHVTSRVNAVLSKVSRFLLGILILITTQQVIARYLFNASSIALQELQQHCFCALTLLTLSTAQANDSHVRVDIFYARFSSKRKILVNFLGCLFGMIPTSIVLIWFGGSFALRALDYPNPRPDDFYTSEIFTQNSAIYEISRGIEGWLRAYLLPGEVSSNPGGLEGKFWIKALLPLAGITLLLQSISDIFSQLVKLKKQ